MSEQLICQRCGGPMEIGFIVDHTYGARLESKWVPGEPTPHWIMGLKMPAAYRVRNYRCTDCGWLDSYAFPPEK